MINTTDYKFKLLKESSASEDLFEDKTHKKIADTLYDVIQFASTEGVTIGLEGGWGSGKSTVVSILKKKLETDTNTKYFYFDAWAHEGDPLRRVFLEALIDKVGHNDVKLQELKDRVSNRKKVSNIKSKQTVTALGKWLAFATFFVPLGAAIISDTASHVKISWSNQINWVFVLGLFCVLAPFYVLACNAIKLWKNNKQILDAKYWMFLQGETRSTVTQEISEDEERSSIEFEKYFLEILKVILSKNDKSKLLIVIDNLDRVDASDSLKLWSTLQTFLQQRNPIEYDSLNYNKVWVLVPYDEEGLAKLWRNRANGHNESKVKNIDLPDDNWDVTSTECAKSFFDKCFQLRIEVPKLILSGWEQFCKENIDQALIGWDEKEKDDVLKVLKLTRNTVNDNPTPREIKTYINQVGLLRLHCDKNISTLSIAYFAILKYMRFHTNKFIEEQLILGALPQERHKLIFNSNCSAELSGILFGVSEEKGHQLLLEPEMEKMLTNKNLEGIKKLATIHKNAFWTVFDLHLPKMVDLNKALCYAYTVKNGLLESYSSKCNGFIGFLKIFCGGLKKLDMPSQSNLDDYIAMFSLLDAGRFDFSKIWKFMINSLDTDMKIEGHNFTFSNKVIASLASCQKQSVQPAFIMSTKPMNVWIEWSKAANGEKFNTYNYIKPHKTITDEIAAQITPSNPIPSGIYDLIEYLYKGGEAQWETVITAIKGHIEWNQGSQSGSIFSIEVFRILAILSRSSQKIQKLIVPLLKTSSFYNLTHYIQQEGAVKYAGLLIATLLPDEMDSIEITSTGHSANGLQLSRSFWETQNNDNAQFIFDELKYKADYEVIWRLAEKENNKLTADIIQIAMKAKCKEFFNIDNPLHLLEIAISITGNEQSIKDDLARCFIELSNIEQIIIDTDKIDIVGYARVINSILEHTNNKVLHKHIINKINSISKEQWDDALVEDTYLPTLVVEIVNKSYKLELENNFYESLLLYLESWIANSVKPSDILKEEILVLVSILKKSFHTQLKNKLANYIIDTSFKGDFDVLSILLDHISIPKIIIDGTQKIQDALDDAFRSCDINSIKVIDLILSHKDSFEFKPAPHLAEVFQSPMKGLLEPNNGVDGSLIERLATKFGVDLSSNNDNTEDRENDESGNSES